MKDLCEAYCSTIFLWCCPNLKADPPAAGLFDEMLLRRVGLAASPDHWHNRRLRHVEPGRVALGAGSRYAGQRSVMKIDVLGMGQNFPGDHRF